MTIQLLNTVKELLSRGIKGNVIADMLNISNPTVSRINKGKYDRVMNVNISERPNESFGYCQAVEPDRVSHTGECRDFKLFDTALSEDEAIQEFNDAMRREDNCFDDEDEEADFDRIFGPHFEDTSRVLVVGDLHEPYSLKGYLEFCQEQYEVWGCNKVVFIGDIADFCSQSYHEKPTCIANPDREYAQTITALQKWFKAFPEATVILGNHDLLPNRKGKTAGIASQIIPRPQDIFKSPDGWKYAEEVVIDGVLYRHGDSGDAFKRCRDEGMSLVQGHLHTSAGVQFFKNRVGNKFGMQVGTGINREHAAFDYASKLAKHQFLSCGVVLDGVQPIVIPYE